MMVADKTRWIKKQQWHGNGQATTVGVRGATMVLITMTIKQQSTNVQRQRLRTVTAGKRQQMNNNGAADKQQ
jgi:hypothetical protein